MTASLVVLVPGFLEFVKIVDEILRADSRPWGTRGPHSPQALRSALMGAIEGLLRDKILAATSHFPATYSDSDIRAVCFTFLNPA